MQYSVQYKYEAGIFMCKLYKQMIMSIKKRTNGERNGIIINGFTKWNYESNVHIKTRQWQMCVCLRITKKKANKTRFQKNKNGKWRNKTMCASTRSLSAQAHAHNTKKTEKQKHSVRTTRETPTDFLTFFEMRIYTTFSFSASSSHDSYRSFVDVCFLWCSCGICLIFYRILAH